MSEAVSNESRRYSVPFLIRGAYTVEVEAQISVRVALDVTLELGALNERVTVNSQLSLLEKETASRAES